MAVIKQKYDEYDLIFNIERLTITIVQKWKYNWNIHEKATSVYNEWTYLEKKDFHDDLDKYIWKNWSNKYVSTCNVVKDGVIGRNSRLGKQIHNKEFSIIFDIKWVLTDPHWTANIYKTILQSDFRSHIDLGNMSVNLTWVDNSISTFSSENTSQNTFSHEFAHTIGADDEYEEKYVGTQDQIDSYNDYYKSVGMFEERYRYKCDHNSLLNIGNSLRNRFLDKIDNRLDKLFTDINFSTYLK